MSFTIVSANTYDMTLFGGLAKCCHLFLYLSVAACGTAIEAAADDKTT